LIRIGVSGESSFWYRPTRVVPDQRPLNGRCCCCCYYYGNLRVCQFVRLLLQLLDTFNGLFSRKMWDFGMQWHQLGHIQTICCISLHTNTSSLNFYRPDALPDAEPTVSKHWRQILSSCWCIIVMIWLYWWCYCYVGSGIKSNVVGQKVEFRKRFTGYFGEWHEAVEWIWFSTCCPKVCCCSELSLIYSWLFTVR